MYLETPPSKEQLKKLISDMAIPVRDVLRQKGTPYEDLDLANAKWSDEELVGNRPQEPKVREVEFFPMEEVLNEEIEVHRQPDH